jgi:hypothetical protein
MAPPGSVEWLDIVEHIGFGRSRSFMLYSRRRLSLYGFKEKMNLTGIIGVEERQESGA